MSEYAWVLYKCSQSGMRAKVWRTALNDHIFVSHISGPIFVVKLLCNQSNAEHFIQTLLEIVDDVFHETRKWYCGEDPTAFERTFFVLLKLADVSPVLCQSFSYQRGLVVILDDLNNYGDTKLLSNGLYYLSIIAEATSRAKKFMHPRCIEGLLNLLESDRFSFAWDVWITKRRQLTSHILRLR
ncbi:unnamed protein product [Gongylonema pulchrum]|uniref:Protein zer-1 homolog-like C-terminal domain-containing protein n=1 Tax=Gongylonema pulchrum TaxID=637853 RepID=A0A3P7N1I0_9BILA|nr:unnamed protein product [Gongylonema pulchrum]